MQKNNDIYKGICIPPRQIMWGYKKNILTSLSVVLFTLLHFYSFSKSNNNEPLLAFQKFSNCSLANNFAAPSNIGKAEPINRYVRNRRSVKEEDDFLPDILPQNEIFYKTSVKVLFPFIKQSVHRFCPGLTLSRAPPALH